jgi:hypothetical protein
VVPVNSCCDLLGNRGANAPGHDLGYTGFTILDGWWWLTVEGSGQANAGFRTVSRGSPGVRGRALPFPETWILASRSKALAA